MTNLKGVTVAAKLREAQEADDVLINNNITAGADIHAGDGGYSVGTQERYDEFVKGRNQLPTKLKIRELAEQAGASKLPGGELSFFGNDSIERFAEAIVRECANHVMTSSDRYRKEYFASKILELLK